MKFAFTLTFFVLIHSASEVLCAQPLKLESATTKHWVGGIGGRSGDNYSFVLTGCSKYKIEFDSVWIKHEGAFSLSPEVTYNGFETNIQSRYENPKATHTITGKRFRIQSLFPSAEEQAELTMKPAVNPFGRRKSEAVLKYRVGKKIFYLWVPKMTVEPTVNHP